MGADGGSIPTRKDLIKGKPAEKFSNKPSFKVCAISGKPLDYTQLVSDFHGLLYNKESVLEYLLSRTKSIPQIHTFKDIIQLDPHLVEGRWKCSLSGKDVVEESIGTSFASALCGHISQASLFCGKCPLCDKKVSTPIIFYASGTDLARQKKWHHEIKKQRRMLRNKLKK